MTPARTIELASARALLDQTAAVLRDGKAAAVAAIEAAAGPFEARIAALDELITEQQKETS